ncbi:DUF4838 domain-containing protein [uncultured Bacteroides sp.]|uniref:DUF4838 domain-containing protein n=1 Tax=uncultured Bacteroides sp. TaxID=162156 RepID=UPI0025E7FAE5|nr:DUF4838 domain-containing protein [uncultured Bacteroides sp.]
MHRFTSHSDRFSPLLVGIVCLCSLLSGCRMQAHTEMFASKEGYLVTIGENPIDKDTRWAKYLYEHLNKRAKEDEMIAFGVSEKDMWRIIIRIDPTLQDGFKLTCKGADISLTASDSRQMLWLQYQLIKKISQEDPRINGSDLPPALINLKDTTGTFAFDYQSIYSPTGLNADYVGVVGLNNFDDSWGIWGHNLRKVLGENAEKLCATIDGKRNEEQLCFSSEDMYRQLESYIVDNYGENAKMRFLIAPDDNPFVCTCSSCTAMGNTTKNATPAVTELIIRLSGRFPHHFFFTTSYLSTRQATEKLLPANAGVMVSAIDLPLRRIDKKEVHVKVFTKQLEQWKKVTKNIYIWDYINNFDDYLTPFPVLKIARQRLQLFKKHGASGIFYNGSGYSYSSLDEMRTFVLSSLLINPDLSVEELVGKFLNQEFPVARKWLYDYYLHLENSTQSGKKLGVYASIKETEESFLHPDKFIKFYDEMGDFVSNAKGKERKKLHELQTALSFTRLELGRNHSYDAYGYAKEDGKTLRPIPQARQWITQLREHKAFAGMEYYSESSDEIDYYIKEWEQYILASDLKKSNLFLGIRPTATSASDKMVDNNRCLLTDGTHGLPGNYHQGWVIIPQDEYNITLPVKGIDASGTVYISFLHLPRHRIYAPLEIELLKDGVSYKKIHLDPNNHDEKGEMVKAVLSADLNGTETLSIKMTGSGKQGAQIGVDEIAFIPS